MHGQLLKLTFAGSIKIDSVLPSYNTFRTAGCIFIAAMASSLAVFNFCLFLSKSKIVWLFKCVTGTCSLFLVQTNFSVEEVVLMVLARLYWLDSTIFIVVTGLWTRVHKVQLLVVFLLLLFLACGLLMWTLSHNPSEVPVLTVPSPLPFSNMFTRQNEHVAVCLELHYAIQLDIGTYIVTSALHRDSFAQSYITLYKWTLALTLSFLPHRRDLLLVWRQQPHRMAGTVWQVYPSTLFPARTDRSLQLWDGRWVWLSWCAQILILPDQNTQTVENNANVNRTGLFFKATIP